MITNISYGTFIFFGVFSVLSFVFTWFFVPETARKSLEEMDAVFGDNQGEKDLKRMQRIQKEILMESRAGGGGRDFVSQNSAEEVGMDNGEEKK